MAGRRVKWNAIWDSVGHLYYIWGSVDIVFKVWGLFGSLLSNLILSNICAKFTRIDRTAVVKQILKVNGPLVFLFFFFFWLARMLNFDLSCFLFFCLFVNIKHCDN